MSENTQEDDLLTITEFADIVGMTANALRHYDKKGVFRPATRGVKFQNEYRYYAPTQFMVAKMFRVLTDIEVPLDEIVGLAKSRSPIEIIKLFSKHKDIVQNQIEFLQEVNSVISTFLELLVEGISAIEEEITVKKLPEKRIIMGGANGYADSGSFYHELTKFYCGQYEPKLNLSYPIGGYFASMDEFMNEPSQPSQFFSLDPKGNERRAEGLYLVGYTRCYYCQTNDLPQRMAKYAKKHKLVFNGPVYISYLFDEISITDPDQYLLQVSASVKETRRVQPHKLRK